SYTPSKELVWVRFKRRSKLMNAVEPQTKVAFLVAHWQLLCHSRVHVGHHFIGRGERKLTAGLHE
ncbi:MAG: hypothetical protein LBU69_00745, partial [Deltaproteobacteria bacterium]|nr:hypothetical protein [Deltaproteobacteria bacterium]